MDTHHVERVKTKVDLQDDLTSRILTLVEVAQQAADRASNATSREEAMQAVQEAEQAAEEAEHLAKTSYANGRWHASLARWHAHAAMVAANKAGEQKKVLLDMSEPERIETFVRSPYFYDALISGCIARHGDKICIVVLPINQDARIRIVAKEDARRFQKTPEMPYLQMPSLYELYPQRLPTYPLNDTYLLNEEPRLRALIDQHLPELQDVIRRIYLDDLPEE